MFECPVTFTYADGSSSAGRVDCYRRGSFVAESKKLKSSVDSERFNCTLREAHAQAQNYARALPASEGRPPFLLIIDIGTVIELFGKSAICRWNKTALAPCIPPLKSTL